jgi:L-2-hydroxyglutarate oxidase
MPLPARCDVAIAGGGIVGLATALALSEPPGLSILVLEAEPRIAAHQSSHNSGVVHSGLYGTPGTLRARLCVEGRILLERFCVEHGVAFERCGKLVVATRAEERPRLAALEANAHANGIGGVDRLGPAGIREREPHATGIEALWVPEAGIADFAGVAAACARLVRERGGAVATGARVLRGSLAGDHVRLETAAGEVRARFTVGCAGLQADRLARACGVATDLRIVPFRGDYYRLEPACEDLVHHLIYPVPDPRLPFLGVHLSRRVAGGVDVGPSAVLALARERYARIAFSARDAWEAIAWPGFVRMALAHGATGIAEAGRSLSARGFAAAARRLVPEIEARHLVEPHSGIRAMAMDRAGRFADDFRFAESARMLHVLGAPSPAATAALAIGRHLAGIVRARLAAL